MGLLPMLPVVFVEVVCWWIQIMKHPLWHQPHQKGGVGAGRVQMKFGIKQLELLPLLVGIEFPS